MELEVIRKNITNKGKVTLSVLKEKKLKVAAYARVSTDEGGLDKSFYSQKKYYEKMISENPNWELYRIYADKGISGTTDNERDGFMRMIADAINGHFDLILTKSISRFSRNTINTLKYVRLLKENNVTVFFEEESINSMDTRGEFLLTVLSSIAQQEAENTSEHVRKGFVMGLKNGKRVAGGRPPYGYYVEQNPRRLVIDTEKAKIVKEMFEMRARGERYVDIARELTAREIKNPSGNDTWKNYTVMQILKNRRYLGEEILGDTYSDNILNHKRKKNKGERDKYVAKDFHQAIISKELFEKVQNIEKKMGRTYFPYVTTGKLICGNCGRNYVRYEGYRNKDICAFKCVKNYKKNRSGNKCENNNYIYVKTFIKIINKSFELLKEKLNKKGDFNIETKEEIKYLKEVYANKEQLDNCKELLKYDGLENELFTTIVKCVILEKTNDYEGRFTPYLNIKIVLKNRIDNLFNLDYKKNLNEEYEELFKFRYIEECNKPRRFEKYIKQKIYNVFVVF